MKPKKYAISIMVFVLLSFFCGCASFRAGNLPPVSQWPPQPTMKGKSVSIVVSGEAILNGKEQEVSANFIEIWREPTVKAYHESGLFSEVKTGLTETDLRAEVKIVDRGKVNLGSAFLTGLTLYLIPSNGTDELVVKTTIKDGEGKTLGTFEKSETITLYQQLFLIFAMPFNFPGSVVKKTLYDLNRATIIEAHSKGCFL